MSSEVQGDMIDNQELLKLRSATIERTTDETTWGGPAGDILTESDVRAFHDLCQGTMTMLKRHQGIYRIVLTAANRPIEGIDKNEKVYVVGNKLLNVIEKGFSKTEWRHPWTTVLSGYVVPILQRIVNKRLAKRT